MLNEFTLKYSEPGYVTSAICQFPLMATCDFLSNLVAATGAVGATAGALDLQAKSKKTKVPNRINFLITITGLKLID
jgi:hypothetical protein